MLCNGKSPATQLTGHHASSAVLSLCREYSTPKGRQGPRKTVDPCFFFGGMATCPTMQPIKDHFDPETLEEEIVALSYERKNRICLV